MSLASMASRTTGTLKRATDAKDASGGMVKTYAAVDGYEDVSCTIHPASSSIRMQYMQRQMNCTHTIFTDEDVPAMSGDIWVSDSRIFQVLGREPKSPGYTQWPAKIHAEEQFG